MQRDTKEKIGSGLLWTFIIIIVLLAIYAEVGASSCLRCTPDNPDAATMPKHKQKSNKTAVEESATQDKNIPWPDATLEPWPTVTLITPAPIGTMPSCENKPCRFITATPLPPEMIWPYQTDE